MASVDWMKLKAGDMRKLAGHYQQELREKLNHSNKHINPEMTKHNYSIGAKDFYEACDKAKARVEEADKEHPPQRVKKDRVVACSLGIVCPPEIADKGLVAASDYFDKVYGKLEDYFGKENVCGGFVHFDEQHIYIDAKTKEKRKSLFHMNVFVVAYVDEEVYAKVPDPEDPKKRINGKKRMQGVNGKTFSSRKHMQEVNRVMEDICHEYGIEWHTGEGKNHETVETLKAKSAKEEREMEEERLRQIAALPRVEIKVNTEIIKERKGFRTEERLVHTLAEPRKAMELEAQNTAMAHRNAELRQLVEIKEKEIKQLQEEKSKLEQFVDDLLFIFFTPKKELTLSWLKRWSEKLPVLDKALSIWNHNPQLNNGPKYAHPKNISKDTDQINP